MTYTPVFTDVIKDVIGDDPVLDQFDVSYEASFYGSMQDDYVTGSMIDEKTSFFLPFKFSDKKKSRSLTPGIRGRIFSKYYAEEQPQLDETYGSAEVSRNPYLSFRTIPWFNRTSTTAFRIAQCYDASERYYDSCIPDVGTCFTLNGSKPWASSKDSKSRGWLSPYRNVCTGSSFFLIFNGPSVDRSSQGFDVDPLVDNDWTWSYPFEPRYSTAKRVTKTNRSMGINSVELQAEYGAYTFTNVTQSLKPILVENFIPILPGRIEKMPPGSRNSFRSLYSVEGITDVDSLSKYPADIHTEAFDNTFGMSYLIPGDVDLSKQVSHDYITDESLLVHDIPLAAPLTCSMTLNDSVKFLFGFGDMNNMMYGSRLLLTSSVTCSHTDDFEGLAVASYAYQVPSFSSTNLSIDWSHAQKNGGTYLSPWKIQNSMGTVVGSNGSTIYHFASGTLTGSIEAGSSPGYIYWASSSYPSNVNILKSDTSLNYYGGTMDARGSVQLIATSSCAVDITSSYPWHLRYKRAIAARTNDELKVYFAGTPEKPSSYYGAGTEFGFYNLHEIENVIGTGESYPEQTTAEMTQYDSKVAGLTGIEVGETYASGTNPWYPFPPGAYRIVFRLCLTSGSAQDVGNPSFAAIDDFQIMQYASDALPPDISGKKFGCNNYPDFARYKVDTRLNPEHIWGSSEYSISGSADRYKGTIYGISPVIRGWKYGLISGFPMNSKAIFRRNKFGQFRDMLEQRQYTKFIQVEVSPCDDEAITKNGFVKEVNSTLTRALSAGSLGPSVAEVSFVKQQYKKDDRGIGYIFNEKVDPTQTVSQNLSTEATSSLPYFDGVARHRTEEDMNSIKTLTTLAVSIDKNSLTVV